jgi:hypothetical protein
MFRTELIIEGEKRQGRGRKEERQEEGKKINT